MIKKIIVGILLIHNLIVVAQQQQQYTQFMFAKQLINPAYAGSNQVPMLTFMLRDQWSGIEGAPKTQLLSFNQGFKSQKAGMGIDLVRNTIGISNTWTLNLNYAYRFKLGNGMLGTGIQASMRYYGVDYTDARLYATQGTTTDPGINQVTLSKYIPNLGLGLYYNTNSYYLGVSIPRILKSDYDFSKASNTSSTEVTHSFIMGGFITKIGEKTKLQPQVLIKAAANTPTTFDLNTNLIYKDKFTLGATYRSGGAGDNKIGESIDLLLGIQYDSKLMFGFSYDIGLSSISRYSNGSLEAIIRYNLRTNTEDEKFVNPRFF
jgi:type IX secretion system PorP/SprF family membrane protein